MEVSVTKETREQRAKRETDLRLDRELEDTFPASDPLKITRNPPKSRSRRDASGDDMPKVDQKEK
jgi:hypothetical protein